MLLNEDRVMRVTGTCNNHHSWNTTMEDLSTQECEYGMTLP